MKERRGTQIIIQLLFSFAKSTLFPLSFLILSDLIPVSSIYGLFPLFFTDLRIVFFRSLITSLKQDGPGRPFKTWMNLFQVECCHLLVAHSRPQGQPYNPQGPTCHPQGPPCHPWLYPVAGVKLLTPVTVGSVFVPQCGTKKISWGQFIFDCIHPAQTTYFKVSRRFLSGYI